MPELPIVLFVAILVAGIVLMMRREHHLLSEADEKPRLNTRGDDE